MLGSLISKSPWKWNACGKNPVAKDYFKIGPDDALLNAFSDWIAKGYQLAVTDKNKPATNYSWRFWAKGTNKNNIVCGIIKDSSDALGRTFPLTVVGTGHMGKWTDNWDLLPFAFDPLWAKAEYLSSKRLLDMKQFEDEIRLLKSPNSDWKELAGQRSVRQKELESQPANLSQMCDPIQIKTKVSVLTRQPDLIVSLADCPVTDPLPVAALWHYCLKSSQKIIPSTVFLGGLSDKQYIAMFNRPLSPNDFVRLWSVV